jgi:uncharacterized protein (DUF302 family)
LNDYVTGLVMKYDTLELAMMKAPEDKREGFKEALDRIRERLEAMGFDVEAL